MKRTSLLLSVLLIMVLTSACSVMFTPGSSTPADSPVVATVPAGENTSSAPVTGAPTTAPTTEPAVDAAATVAAPPADQPAGTISDEQFDAQLAQAIERKDFAALRAMMGSSFALAYWRSEGLTLSPDQAIEQLNQGPLAPGSTPASAFGMDTTALLEGTDPLAIFPPDAVRAFYLDFVGPAGTDQAIAVVGRDPATGRRYWKGLLVAFGGFRMEEPSMGDLNAFSEKLAQAVQARNFDAMRNLMYGKFLVATLNQSLYGYSFDEALNQMRGGVFAPGSAPSVRWGTGVPALLNGADPFGQWGPVAQPVRAAHVTGLNSSGSGEAVLMIGRDPSSGQFYWLGILMPENGISFEAPVLEPVGDAQPTSVRFVEALEEINARTGPGLNYAVEGRLRQGEIAQVSGISPDGGWWQIYCTQDASGRCWISADSSLTRPTSQ